MRRALVLLVFLLGATACLAGELTVLVYDTVPTAEKNWLGNTVYESRLSDKYDFWSVVTVGNRSYIPLSVEGTTHERRHTILNVLHKFEEAHPEWKMGSWFIEKHTNHCYSYIYGIWVNHEPKEGK